jgi:hypothetical protein
MYIDKIKIPEPLTRSIKLIGSSWFLLLLLLPRQICNSLYRDRSSARNKTLYTLTCNLLPTSLVLRHSYSLQNLFLDSKNHPVPSLRCDSFMSKVPGICPDVASGNTTSLYCLAVNGQAECTIVSVNNT